ncbi:RagB/SusD family nutrient uptake outer membrane protein [Pedobacter frigidisoli]|uniref:RagB/SusD family nutrient uptake outer membrane protein n=1 Tax=Pedobacter frigidisoli TaxID=2530455 RepID=UPI00292DC2A9|nr:RagB/SusD family nutrient uptake outer membrane protein [Pedobacter frigidisoli]
MKKIILGLVGAILALTVITSCKKLDLTPYDAVAIETGFKTLQDAKYWDNGLYAALRARVYGSYNIPQEVQGEQLNASLDFGNRNGAPHRWGTFFNADDVAGVYQGYYNGLSNVNIVIKGYDQITPTSAAETDSLNTFKADARLLRAYYLQNLALRYAKAYNPATAASDAGIPLLTEFDLTAKPGRATLKATYDQILADIAVAKSLNTKRVNHKGAKYFTPDAILAFEARVRLYMQDWAGAYAAANTLIASGRYPLYNTAAAIKSYWTNDTYQEDIFRIAATLAEQVNTNSIYLGLNSAGTAFVPDFIPTQTVVDSYDATDLRKPTYFEQKTLLIQGVRYNNVWLVNKYPGNPALFTSTITNYQNANKIFRIGEIYAIAAEAAANAGDVGNAVIHLNALRTARGLTALSGLTGGTLLDQIRAERTRELNFEGLHLFDLKRWGLGFTRGTAQVPAAVNPNTGFINLTISATDPKFTWGLPTNDLLLNPNLTQNPGW